MTDDIMDRYATANLQRAIAWTNAKRQVRDALPHETTTRRERRKAWLAKRRQMPRTSNG